MNPWDADILLSAEGARELVREQFPDIPCHTFHLFSSGWDNDAYLADETIVFRFPRRKVAAPLIANEVRILPLLEPHLPLPISASRWIGQPTDRFPHTWAGYSYMPGNTSCRMEWTDEERAQNARLLAEFLRALHSVPVDDKTRKWAPLDELAKTDMQLRLPRIRDRLARFPEILPKIDAEAVDQIATALAQEAINNRQSTGKEVWVHGDFYARHILVDEKKSVVGVIDWGDVHLGDIAGDLSIAFTSLPAFAYEEFRRVYGDIDQATWNGAKFRSIFHATTIAEYGHGIGDPHLVKAAYFCLRSITDQID